MVTVTKVPKETKIKKDSTAEVCYDIRRFEWARKVGGSLTEAGTGVCVDDSGNSYLTGSFYGSAKFDKEKSFASRGQDDMFICKYDRKGELVWARHIGDSSIQAGIGICLDSSGNIFLTGYNRGWESFGKGASLSSGSSNIYISKFNPDGKIEWTRTAGGSGSDAGTSICCDKYGNIYVTGYFEGSISFGSGYYFTSRGNSDAFVAKYSHDGKIQWALRAGGLDLDGGNGICVDNMGYVYVSGFFEDRALFEKLTLESEGYCDIFTAKISPDGHFLWAKRGGSESSDDYGYDIAIDSEGFVYTTGMTSGNSIFDDKELEDTGNFDIFLAKYNSLGDIQWVKQAGGKLADAGYGISLSGTGYIYLTGYIKETARFDTTIVKSAGQKNDNVFIAKYTTDGNIVWVNQAGGSKRDYGFGIGNDNFGNSYLSGYFEGEAGFGDISVASVRRSIFIASLKEYDSCLTKNFEVTETRVDSVVQKDTVYIDD